jgi:hypothetical protein
MIDILHRQVQLIFVRFPVAAVFGLDGADIIRVLRAQIARVLGFDFSPCRLLFARTLQGTDLGYLNPAGFAIPPAYTMGTLGRVLPNVRAFGTRNEDFNLLKRIAINERFRSELQFNFFNLLNRHGWGVPNVDPTSPAFGTIRTAQNPRYGQAGIKFVW